MKGISSKDGKMAGNVQLVDRYNESKGHARPKEKGGESGGEHDLGGKDENVRQIVEEHGPAHEVHVEHDHEAQHSTVTSHHEDGHKHVAHYDGEDHHAKAHAHAAHMAGVHDSEQLHEAHQDLAGQEHEEEEREEEIHPGIHAQVGARHGFMPEDED